MMPSRRLDRSRSDALDHSSSVAHVACPVKCAVSIEQLPEEDLASRLSSQPRGTQALAYGTIAKLSPRSKHGSLSVSEDDQSKIYTCCGKWQAATEPIANHSGTLSAYNSGQPEVHCRGSLVPGCSEQFGVFQTIDSTSLSQAEVQYCQTTTTTSESYVAETTNRQLQQINCSRGQPVVVMERCMLGEVEKIDPCDLFVLEPQPEAVKSGLIDYSEIREAGYLDHLSCTSLVEPFEIEEKCDAVSTNAQQCWQPAPDLFQPPSDSGNWIDDQITCEMPIALQHLNRSQILQTFTSDRYEALTPVVICEDQGMQSVFPKSLFSRSALAGLPDENSRRRVENALLGIEDGIFELRHNIDSSMNSVGSGNREQMLLTLDLALEQQPEKLGKCGQKKLNSCVKRRIPLPNWPELQYWNGAYQDMAAEASAPNAVSGVVVIPEIAENPNSALQDLDLVSEEITIRECSSGNCDDDMFEDEYLIREAVKLEPYRFACKDGKFAPALLDADLESATIRKPEDHERLKMQTGMDAACLINVSNPVVNNAIPDLREEEDLNFPVKDVLHPTTQTNRKETAYCDVEKAQIKKRRQSEESLAVLGHVAGPAERSTMNVNHSLEVSLSMPEIISTPRKKRKLLDEKQERSNMVLPRQQRCAKRRAKSKDASCSPEHTAEECIKNVQSDLSTFNGIQNTKIYRKHTRSKVMKEQLAENNKNKKRIPEQVWRFKRKECMGAQIKVSRNSGPLKSRNNSKQTQKTIGSKRVMPNLEVSHIIAEDSEITEETLDTGVKEHGQEVQVEFAMSECDNQKCELDENLKENEEESKRLNLKQATGVEVDKDTLKSTDSKGSRTKVRLQSTVDRTPRKPKLNNKQKNKGSGLKLTSETNHQVVHVESKGLTLPFAELRRSEMNCPTNITGSHKTKINNKPKQDIRKKNVLGKEKKQPVGGAESKETILLLTDGKEQKTNEQLEPIIAGRLNSRNNSKQTEKTIGSKRVMPNLEVSHIIAEDSEITEETLDTSVEEHGQEVQVESAMNECDNQKCELHENLKENKEESKRLNLEQATCVEGDKDTLTGTDSKDSRTEARLKSTVDRTPRKPKLNNKKKNKGPGLKLTSETNRQVLHVESKGLTLPFAELRSEMNCSTNVTGSHKTKISDKPKQDIRKKNVLWKEKKQPAGGAEGKETILLLTDGKEQKTNEQLEPIITSNIRLKKTKITRKRKEKKTGPKHTTSNQHSTHADQNSALPLDIELKECSVEVSSDSTNVHSQKPTIKTPTGIRNRWKYVTPTPKESRQKVWCTRRKQTALVDLEPNAPKSDVLLGSSTSKHGDKRKKEGNVSNDMVPMLEKNKEQLEHIENCRITGGVPNIDLNGPKSEKLLVLAQNKAQKTGGIDKSKEKRPTRCQHSEHSDSDKVTDVEANGCKIQAQPDLTVIRSRKTKNASNPKKKKIRLKDVLPTPGKKGWFNWKTLSGIHLRDYNIKKQLNSKDEPKKKRKLLEVETLAHENCHQVGHAESGDDEAALLGSTASGTLKGLDDDPKGERIELNDVTVLPEKNRKKVGRPRNKVTGPGIGKRNTGVLSKSTIGKNGWVTKIVKSKKKRTGSKVAADVPENNHQKLWHTKTNESPVLGKVMGVSRHNIATQVHSSVVGLAKTSVNDEERKASLYVMPTPEKKNKQVDCGNIVGTTEWILYIDSNAHNIEAVPDPIFNGSCKKENASKPKKKRKGSKDKLPIPVINRDVMQVKRHGTTAIESDLKECRKEAPLSSKPDKGSHGNVNRKAKRKRSKPVVKKHDEIRPDYSSGTAPLADEHNHEAPLKFALSSFRKADVDGKPRKKRLKNDFSSQENLENCLFQARINGSGEDEILSFGSKRKEIETLLEETGKVVGNGCQKINGASECRDVKLFPTVLDDGGFAKTSIQSDSIQSDSTKSSHRLGNTTKNLKNNSDDNRQPLPASGVYSKGHKAKGLSEKDEITTNSSIAHGRPNKSDSDHTNNDLPSVVLETDGDEKAFKPAVDSHEPVPVGRHCNDLENKSCLVCNYCRRVLRDAVDYKNHLQAHICTDPIPCPVCGRSFATYTAIKRHMQQDHDRYKRHTCRSCGRGFCRLPAYKRHIQIHIKPFRCRKCKARFSRHSLFLRHLTSHNEKQYPCGLCGDVYFGQSQWCDHVKAREFNRGKFETNSANSPPQGKSISTNPSVVKSTARMELGPYYCEICGNMLMYWRSYVRHMRMMHEKRKRVLISISLKDKSIIGTSSLKKRLDANTERDASVKKSHFAIASSATAECSSGELSVGCTKASTSTSDSSDVNTKMEAMASIDFSGNTSGEHLTTGTLFARQKSSVGRKEKYRLEQTGQMKSSKSWTKISDKKMSGCKRKEKCSPFNNSNKSKQKNSYAKRNSECKWRPPDTEIFRISLCKFCGKRFDYTSFVKHTSTYKDGSCMAVSKITSGSKKLATQQQKMKDFKGKSRKAKSKVDAIAQEDSKKKVAEDGTSTSTSGIVKQTGNRRRPASSGKKLESAKDKKILGMSGQHFRCLHPGRIVVRCIRETCGFLYVTKKSMMEHCQKAHPLFRSDPPAKKPLAFVCDTCSKSFSDSKALKYHSPVHGDSTYACNLCNRVLFPKSNVISHFKTHVNSGELKSIKAS